MTIQELLNLGKRKLETLEEGPLEARLLLEFTLDCSHHEILMQGQTLALEAQQATYLTYCDKRLSGQPIQQIMEMQDFYGHVFKVNAHTLIPRQETESLVDLVIQNLKKKRLPQRVVDVGTGTGCIPISIVKALKHVTALGLDISKEALEVARYNTQMYQLEDRVSFLESDLFSALDATWYGTVQVITSNPPYIPTRVIDTLEGSVRDFEPHLALDGGEDGLDFYRRLVIDAWPFMTDGGWVIFEVGHDQGQAVCDLLTKAGFEAVAMEKDLYGVNRMVHGKKPVRI